MVAVVKLEPLWLLEDQAVMDGITTEKVAITFPDIKDEFQKADMEILKYNTFQNDAEMNEENPMSEDRNEEIKTEIVIEEHSILDSSSECIPIYNRSDNTDAQEYPEINIDTVKPDRTDTKHMKIHTEEKLFEYEVCNKTFAWCNAPAAHVRTGDKPFKCDVCSKCFTQSGHLKVHTKSHTRERPFKCEVCSKSFTRSNVLRDHVRIHTCEACSKGFATLRALRDHVCSHNGDKHFKCEECSMYFSRSHIFKVHIQTHTKGNPFKCFNLIRRMKTHTRK